MIDWKQISRRSVLALALLIPMAPACAASASLSRPAVDYADGMHVVLTGTGHGFHTEQGGSGVAVVVDGMLLQFDAGPMTRLNLMRAGLLPRYKIDRLFFTHLHADHISDYVDLNAHASSFLSEDLEIYGPVFTDDMVDAANRFIRSHVIDETAVLDAVDAPEDDVRAVRAALANARAPVVTEIVGQTAVLIDDSGLKVVALQTPHAQSTRTASFAYRVTTGYGSVVISGDTAPTLAMAEFAQGADILIHEVTHPEPEDAPAVFAMWRHVRFGDPLGDYRSDLPMLHTTPIQLGRLAEQAGVAMLITYHTTYGRHGELKDRFRRQIEQSYGGDIRLGAPLLTVSLDGGR